jgi:hypothetical protein
VIENNLNVALPYFGRVFNPLMEIPVKTVIDLLQKISQSINLKIKKEPGF